MFWGKLTIVGLFFALFASLFILPTPAFAEKERLVVMRVQGAGLSSADLNSYRAAVVKGLSQKYEVLSGDQIDKKVEEIFKKESEKTTCDTEKCFAGCRIRFSG